MPQRGVTLFTCALSTLFLVLAAPVTIAQDSVQPSRRSADRPPARNQAVPTFKFTSFARAQDAPTTQEADRTPREAERSTSEFHYREISDFFDIREAYANVVKGEWEFETTFEWETESDGSDDDIGPIFSLTIMDGISARRSRHFFQCDFAY